MWWLAEQMAGEEPEPEAAPRPPKRGGRRRCAAAVFRANDEVWAAMRRKTYNRLGVTAAKVEELGLTEDRAFVDLAQPDSFTLPGRPFAMVGRSAQSISISIDRPSSICARSKVQTARVQLDPIAGVVAARNETLIENPGRLARTRSPTTPGSSRSTATRTTRTAPRAHPRKHGCW